MSVFVDVLMIALQLSRLSYTVFPLATLMEVSPEQQAKAPSPILLTKAGIVTEFRPLQPLKALSPILVTEFGMLTEFRPLQP